MTGHAAESGPGSPGRRYHDFRAHLRRTFGARVAKLPVDAGFTCPNRDGTTGLGGCVYCDGRGSRLRQAGPLPSVTAQLAAGRERYLRLGAERFIPYFQTFTNTHGPLERLRSLWDEAAGFAPEVVGLAVGTRPDCVPEPVLALLARHAARLPVYLELGLQSSHDATLERLNRRHTRAQFEDAVRRAAAHGLLVVAHVILGLPGEDAEMMRATARAMARLPLAGLKIHSLLVLEGTALAADWRRGRVPLPDLATYAGWVADFLELLPPRLFLQRLAADGHRDIFLAPAWAANKFAVIRAVERELQGRDTRQGRLFA